MLLSEDARQVVVPGTEGDFTVLEGHAPVISAIRPGVMDVVLAGDRRVRLFVRGGFAEVDGDHLTVLAQKAFDLQSMDAATIASELQIAEGDLADAIDDAARRDAHTAVESLRNLQH
jgi:F-type H+-transporting ATPase subunit epsilon